MLRRIVALIAIAGLTLQQSAFAQGLGRESLPGPVLNSGGGSPRDVFRPPHLRYFSYDNVKETVRVILEKGDSKDAAQDESRELLAYFLTGVSLPNDTFWVNLRPDSPDDVIDPLLEKTEMGRVMLAADLQLKKDTAALTSPGTPTGRTYWNKLYKKAAEIYGNEKTSIPTLTRPWIVPGEIIVKETQGSALVYKASLRIMLEQDYLKDSREFSFQDERAAQLNAYSSQLIKEIIIPELTREVNTARRYAALRQVYFSLILSRWFKSRFNGKPGTYASRIDSKDISGIASKERWSKNEYFEQYRRSFNSGEYDVKEQVTTPTGQVIRRYVSGGMNMDGGTLKIENGYTAGIDNAARYGQILEADAVLPDAMEFKDSGLTAGAGSGAEGAIVRPQTLARQLDGGKATYIGDEGAKYTVANSNLPLRVMYLRDGQNMNAFEIFLNPEYSPQELAGYVLHEVYNRLTIFGAEEVVIDVDSAVYNEFINLYNTPINGRGYQSISGFLNMVYELSGEHQFRIRQAKSEEFDSLAASASAYTPASQDFRDLRGNYVGIDIGGSDIKVCVLQDGKVTYTHKENWQPDQFTSVDQHMKYFQDLMNAATSSTGIDTKTLTALGISFNLVVVNNRPTGQGPVTSGLKGEEMERIKNMSGTLSNQLGVPVYILNDGDAGALWSAVRENSPNTLALALGTGLAGGYADANLNVRSYLTEMGNVVLSLEEGAMGHSYSNVPGAAQRYLSQRLPFTLAEKAGIDLNGIPGNAEKLVRLQEMFAEGDSRVVEIFTQVAKYMAEYVLYVNTIMPINNVCLFGRVMSRAAGRHVLENLRRIFAENGVPIKVTVPEGEMVEFAQAEGAAIYAAGNTAKDGGKKDDQMTAPGGIDFRSLPMNIEPMGSFSALQLTLPAITKEQASRINIGSEIKKLRKLIASGTMPSEERISELVALCRMKGELNRQSGSLLLCLSELLKQQESKAEDTTPGFRALLMYLDAQ